GITSGALGEARVSRRRASRLEPERLNAIAAADDADHQAPSRRAQEVVVALASREGGENAAIVDCRVRTGREIHSVEEAAWQSGQHMVLDLSSCYGGLHRLGASEPRALRINRCRPYYSNPGFPGRP